MLTKHDIANNKAFTPPSEYLVGVDGAEVRRRIRRTKYNIDTKAGLAYKKSQMGLLNKPNKYLEKLERKSRVQIYYRMMVLQIQNNKKYPELFSPVPSDILKEYQILFALGQYF